MSTVTMHQAKTHLSRLVARACAGEDIVIARGSTPVVRIVPLAVKGKRRPGSLQGRLQVPPSFFEPLPEDELAAWE